VGQFYVAVYNTDPSTPIVHHSEGYPYMNRARSIPAVAKLIGPSVAASLITHPVDYELLLMSLHVEDSETRKAAVEALQYVVGALLASAPDAQRPLVGPNAPPWCDLLERCSRTMDTPVIPIAHALLMAVCEQPGAMTGDERALAGIAARRLLTDAWARGVVVARLAVDALRAVCRTFEGDPAASSILLRQAVTREHLERYGAEEMRWLAQELGRLAPLDADLVADVYHAAFGYQETSEEKTRITPGTIAGMTSTRQQDYHGALLVLANAYPAFLEAAPRQATRTLIDILDLDTASYPIPNTERVAAQQFTFRSGQASIRSNRGVMPTSMGISPSDNRLRLLESFGGYLRQTCADPDRLGDCRAILDVIASCDTLPLFWKRLLVWGSADPSALGLEVRSLAWATPILITPGTTVEAGAFIAAIYPLLSREEKVAVERAIFSIPACMAEARQAVGRYYRDRLLGCIPIDGAVTDEARVLLRDSITHGGPPPNTPPIEEGDAMSGLVQRRVIAMHEGLPAGARSTGSMGALEVVVEEFTASHQQSVSQKDAIDAVLPALQSLHAALGQAAEGGIPPGAVAYGWTILAVACECIARAPRASCDTSIGAFVTSVLLEAIHRPHAAHDPQMDALFAEHLLWSGHDVRIAAAHGIALLARHPNCATRPVLQAIDIASRDDAPQVRYQIARRLDLLAGVHPSFAWDIAGRLCHEEPNSGVLQGVTRAMEGFIGLDHGRAATLLREVLGRITDSPGAGDLRVQCVSLLVLVYLRHDHEPSRQIVYGVANNPLGHIEVTEGVAFLLQKRLTIGPIDPPDPTQDAVRGRVFALLDRLVSSVCMSIHSLLEQYEAVAFGSWPQEAQGRARALFRLAQTLAQDIHLGSGAFDDKLPDGDPNKGPSTKEKRRHFLREAGPTIDKLADVPITSVAHDLLETLGYLIPVAPAEIFGRIGHIVEVGQRSGYHNEPLAIGLIVGLVEQYLADYRPVFLEDADLQRLLVAILDAFVAAGWPAAIPLTYRIGDIYH